MRAFMPVISDLLLGRVPTTEMARFLVNFPPLFVSFSLLAAGKPRQIFLDWRKIASKIVPFPLWEHALIIC